MIAMVKPARSSSAVLVLIRVGAWSYRLRGSALKLASILIKIARAAIEIERECSQQDEE